MPQAPSAVVVYFKIAGIIDHLFRLPRKGREKGPFGFQYNNDFIVIIPYRPETGDMVFRCGGVSVRLRSLSCGREPYGPPTNAPLLSGVLYTLVVMMPQAQSAVVVYFRELV